VSKLNFDEKGLIPAIIQDDATGDVLMLGYMNEESLRRTLESGEVWFFSRSRQELWHKGATSGNKLAVRSIRIDCEDNSLLVKAQPSGPTCHTGHKSCFFRELDKKGQVKTQA
jgi:phosphoribosyl-AMP cyclohydrolase